MLLAKRLKVKEEKLEQRTTIVLSGVMFVAGFTIAGLNVRYQWLILPNWVIWFGTLFFFGLYLLMRKY